MRFSSRSLTLFSVFCLCIGVVSTLPAQQQPPPFQLIPTPQIISRGEGAFVFTADTKIVLGSPKNVDDQFAASQLSDELRSELGLSIPAVAATKGKSVLLGNIERDKTVQQSLSRAHVDIPDKLGDEGYILHISPTSILIAAHSAAGVFYGTQTLRQMIRSNREGNALPCLTIADWPALRYRGWMNDISRGPIPTVAFLKQVIQRLAEYKQNFFTLYTEHVFRLKSHPEIAPADGITPEDIAELTAFAKKYHIELIGNAQSFGHMENQLRSPFYNDIKENPWVVTPAAEATYKFLKEEYDEIVPAYKSTLFHINCDEVYGLGLGPGKRMVDSMGMPAVYAYHINRINDLIKPYGKRILMWGDIAAQNPSIIPKLPKDLVVLSWGYDPEESFEAAILPFKKTGFDFMISPGVNCWTEVWPNMSAAAINISNYVRDGAKLGAMGMMNTAWDDDGENFFTYNWHGLLWGAECSWHPAQPLTGDDARRDRERRLDAFNRSFDELLFGTKGVAETLFQFDTLRHVQVPGIVRDYGVWSSMLEPDLDNPSGEPLSFACDRASKMAEDLLARLSVLKVQVRRNGDMLDFATFAAKRVRFTAEKVSARIALHRIMHFGEVAKIPGMKADLAQLLAELHSLKAEYVGLWQRENRSWWLDKVLDKYDQLGNQLVDLDKAVIIEPSSTLTGTTRSVALRTAFNEQPIYYTIDGSEPTLRSAVYAGPFTIDHSTLIRARVYIGRQPYPLAEKYVLMHKAIGKLYKLNSTFSRYNRAYSAGGTMGLLDGLRGSDNFADGRWQGYQGQDLDIVIDLGTSTPVKNISIGFLQNSFSWILMPEKVQIFVSNEPEKYVLTKEILNTVDPREDGAIIRDFAAGFTQLTTRFIRIVAKNPGKLPSWHQSAGSDSYIFADEIIVE
ncbi:MAG TPA: glycoside hydrolase family 20 zincin-like fold domain-containing protein [Bacteroidota bacterium]|nr:glycoside hydrolase family 20 zincin-like fold domain-containing protein [Bacteroidota bacterium]